MLLSCLAPFYVVTRFSPKKWGLDGTSSALLVAFLGGVSFLLSQGIDIRPKLAVTLGLAFVDSVFLGGSCLAQISSYWPPYRRRILVHEAGHLLTGMPRHFISSPLIIWIPSPLIFWSTMQRVSQQS